MARRRRGQGNPLNERGLRARYVAPKIWWHFGKLDGSLSSTAGSSATMSIWNWISGAWTDTTKNLTVYAPPLLSSGSIASGKWVRAEYHAQSRRWYVVSAEC